MSVSSTMPVLSILDILFQHGVIDQHPIDGYDMV